jgi:hypothetical protein
MGGYTLHAGLLTEAPRLLRGLLRLVSTTVRVCCVSSLAGPLAPRRAPDCTSAPAQVPIMVHGHIVNWIDSKATFGSARVHQCAPSPSPARPYHASPRERKVSHSGVPS